MKAGWVTVVCSGAGGIRDVRAEIYTRYIFGFGRRRTSLHNVLERHAPGRPVGM